MIVSLIAAVDEQEGIGKDNKIPWHLPSDLKRFKQITMGHHVIMGRVTYESIGKPLPGRVMIIVTHQANYPTGEYLIAHSLDAAISLAKENYETELFIIGGSSIFKQAIVIADKIYLTKVHTVVGADTFFPKLDPNQWERFSQEDNIQNKSDLFYSSFLILLRKH